MFKEIKSISNKYIRKLEIYLETNSAVHIVVGFILVVVSFLLAAIDVFELFEEIPDGSLPFLLVFLFLFILIIDYKHVRLLNTRRLVSKKYLQDIRNLRKLIWIAATVREPTYRISSWQEKHEIDSDGNMIYTRRTYLECDQADEYWFVAGVNLLEGDAIERLGDLDISAKNVNTGERLSWSPVYIVPNRIRLAIVLDPYIAQGGSGCVEFKLRWNGAYAPLVKNFTDIGGILIKYPTERIKIEFVSPKGIQFTGFRIDNGLGTYNIVTTPGGRTLLEFTAENIPIGEYNYQLNCEKMA